MNTGLSNKCRAPATSSSIIKGFKDVSDKNSDKLKTLISLKIQAMKHLHYKPAKLFTANNDLKKEWFVYYYFLMPNGKFKRFKVRENINRIPTVAARKEYGKAMVQAMNELLEVGFDPTKPFNPKEQNTTVKEALTELLDTLKLQVRFRTHHSYLYGAKLFYSWEEVQFSRVSEITVDTVYKFQTYLSQKPLSNRTVNNTMETMVILFNKLHNNDRTYLNPFAEVRPLMQEVGTKNIPFTDEEVQKISKVLHEEHPRLWLFVQFIYYCFTRPTETLNLKIKDIDLEAKSVCIIASNSKNRSTARVLIPDELIEKLKQLKLHKLPSEYYIFSNDDLKPGPNSIRLDKVNRLWRALIKLKHNIDKDMYAAKHTGNIHLVLSGANLREIQLQNRHSSLEQTEKYLKTMTVNVKSDIMKRFREF